MGAETGIAWADSTFNPWWGCVKISAGCTNCYADTFDRRLGGDHWGPRKPRRFFGEKHWNQIPKWNRQAEAAGVRRRVFVASMADWAEYLPTSHPSHYAMIAARQRMWMQIHDAPWLDFLMLTKREDRLWLLPWISQREDYGSDPWDNVWVGVTAENQEAADRRIPALLATPAAVRWVSHEPALGPIRFGGMDVPLSVVLDDTAKIDWVITGGESGHGRRPFDEDWARHMRDQCWAAGVAFFYKQKVTAEGVKIETPKLDGERWTQFPRAA